MLRKYYITLIVMVVVAAGALVATLVSGSTPTLGLDLQGGASVVLQPKDPNADTSLLDTSIEIIRNRVDALGVAEPEISRQGNAILVELPGVKDQQRALDLVGKTAELRFRPVLQVGTVGNETSATTVPLDASGNPVDTSATDSSAVTTGAASTAVPSATTATAPPSSVAGGPGGAVGLPRQAATTTPATTVAAATTVAGTDTTTAGTTTTVAGATTTIANDPNGFAQLKGKDGQSVYLVGPAGLTGAGVSSAEARFNQGQWEVALSFNSQGSALFDQLAAKCYQAADPANCPSGRIAIELDDLILSAPTVQQPQFGGNASITGQFSEGEAKDLALALRYGALPIELEPQAVQTVSATLGKDSLHAGVIAGLVGVGLVLLFMLLYYRALGLVVFLGIAVSASLLWSIVCLLSETRGLALTLSGCAGIIVSIGVTVDSYVVYFERLKDEVRGGKSLRSSAERGFSSAYRTILAADGASLIGALLLYWLTVGSVRGFAFYLALSTLLDMVVAYFFTRPLVAILARKLKGANILGVRMGEALTTAEAGAIR